MRRFTDAMARPAVIYIKSDNYLKPATLAALAAEGRVVSVKYAVVRVDPAHDPYLRQLLAHVAPTLITSGIGERPAIVHFSDFGLSSMTSGSVCVAPRGQLWGGAVVLGGFALHPLVLVFALSGSLMISRIRIPKF